MIRLHLPLSKHMPLHHWEYQSQTTAMTLNLMSGSNKLKQWHGQQQNQHLTSRIAVKYKYGFNINQFYKTHHLRLLLNKLFDKIYCGW